MHLRARSRGIQQLLSKAWAHSSITTQSKWSAGRCLRGPSSQAPVDAHQSSVTGPRLFADRGSPFPSEATLTCVGRQHDLCALQDLSDGRRLPAPQLFPQLADFPSEVCPLSFVTHLPHASLIEHAGFSTNRSTAIRTRLGEKICTTVITVITVTTF